ncbi:MAG: DUF1080 domain-containing protein [Bryobacteraceae bacterium]|nr:DUF1080 domain-containing protein [Bryobacteraceae bacterium]
MRNNFPAIVLGFAVVAVMPGFQGTDADFNGRWNIAIPSEARSRAWWLEVQGAGGAGQLKGRFVGAPGGGMYEPNQISIRGGELTFVFLRKYGIPAEKRDYAELPDRRGVYKARLVDGKLQGTFEVEGHPATRLDWTGERAPEITDRDDGTWKEQAPVELFNGNDLRGWTPMIPGKELGWSVQDGILTNSDDANNLVSERKFWNFKLRAEYRLVPGSNSGIGLRGRYEIQIADDHGRPPTVQSHGSLYSRIAPRMNASKPPGEWQTMEITLIGRDVTVVLNGHTVIEKGVVEGLTAMGHDPHEDQPGPISVQGDHRKVEIRKLTVTPLKKG